MLRTPLYFLFFLFTITVSCNEPNGIGLDVQPKGDLLSDKMRFSDTLSLNTYTVKDDSLRADANTLNLLGSFHDPIFGNATASFYTQVGLSGNNVTFGSKFDSLVLTLAYRGSYGDTSSIQIVKVYELTDNIYKDSVYYSNRTFAVSSQIGTISFMPTPTTSVYIDKTTTTPCLRIKMDDTFGQKLFNAGTTNLNNNENFIKFMKGIYVTTDNLASSAPLAILYFDLLSSYSKLTMYYDTTHSYSFVINGQATRINHFTHDYTGTKIQDQLNDPILGKDVDYLQSMSGLKTKISIPNLSHLLDSGMISINKAELVIKVLNGTTIPYAPPATIALARIDSLGQINLLSDQSWSASYYGGSYDAVNGTYKFNIARHLQDVLSKKTKDYGLYLFPLGAAVSANRAIIGGGNNTNYKMKLNLTYTKL